MQDKSFVPFTEEMKKDYVILAPNMLPLHFKLILTVMKNYGYNTELLTACSQEVKELGLKYTHNDTCYPAILVVGQFMEALLSGRYDPHKTALIMFQTGGGCRASNYISLIRKALKKAGLEFVPVISLSLHGIEKHPGFKLTPKMIYKMLYGIFYGDLLMSLVNQTKPYELVGGQAQKLADLWCEKIAKDLSSNKKIKYKNVINDYKQIVHEFSSIPVSKEKKVKVGIVGEIFVKYSPLGNNNLEDFLVKQGAEVELPGLVDFCLYSVYDSIMEHKVYGQHKLSYPLYVLVYKWLDKKRADISNVMSGDGKYRSFTPFSRIVELGNKVITTTVKMGEGWLLPAEMLELAESGCENIVCTQPFGCLPNHICGKGMMKPVKEIIPNANIVAIDYDASSSKVNQENRLKLMLSNAKSVL